jgi:hypothetical protein
LRTGRPARERWQNQRDGEQTRQKRGRLEDRPGKEAMRLHREKQACPRRRKLLALKTVLSCCQTERGGKEFWDAEQLERDLTSRWRTRLASEPRLSTRGGRALAVRGKGALRLAVAKLRRQAAGSPRCVGVARVAYRPVGVLSGSNPERRRGAGPTRRGCSRTLIRRGARGGFPVPDTACVKGSRDNRGSWRWRVRADCHRLRGAKRRGCNVLPAGQQSAPSGGRAKSWPENRPAFQGKARDLLALALHSCLLYYGLCDGESKLPRAHRRRLKHMPQFQQYIGKPHLRYCLLIHGDEELNPTYID